MRFSQPESNHNAGHIVFGADDMLYIATGDGGGGGDLHGTCGNGQNTGNLLGKILRIDPTGNATESPDCAALGAGPYTIPAGNPLNDGFGGDCDEIWAYGLRNPWRWSFDSINDDIYIGDVGQGCWEEINWVDSSLLGGQNYGWRQMEGQQCYNAPSGCTPPGLACGTSPPCNDPSLTLPVLAYDSTALACSVTGGHVYRGCRMPMIDGAYFYGDFCDGTVRSFKIAGGLVTQRRNWTTQVDPSGSLGFSLTSFGVDAQGEMYVVDRGGSVMKFLPPFTAFEVSGPGAANGFLLQRNGNWTWEDLFYSTMHPVDYYSVHRGTPNGAFSCIHSTLSNGWPAGDATNPTPGQLLAYLVTAHEGVEESSAGLPVRTLINPCAAP
jgi:hypothetical protein